MNQQLLAAMGRERRRALKEDFARGDLFGNGLRILAARVLRAAGEGLFRLGMALDERVTAEPIAETPNA
jgi:hypothetical protein